jgi:hypothetical protein
MDRPGLVLLQDVRDLVATTPASSLSVRVSVNRPANTPMWPPTRAKALICSSCTTK